MQTLPGNVSNLGFFDNFSSLLTPYLRSKSKTFSLSGGGDQKFHITIFPSIDLYDRYHTSTPLKVMLIVVFIVVALILLFGSYDFLVRGFSRILNRVTQKMQGPTSLTLSFVKLAVSVYGTRDIKSIIFPNEIERDDITQLDVLGKGAFGIVYKGLLRVLDSPSFLVALKTIASDISAENIKEVMCEALLMNQLRHDHVCRLVGICPSSSSAPMLMIIQYCEFGSLDDVFKKYDNQFIFHAAKFLMAADVASGLSYIHEQNVVHRDVAARNVLVDSMFRCRIGDFGHARLAPLFFFATHLPHGRS